MRCALYLRVSTTNQETDNQVLALRDYASRRGLEIVETYHEQESAWKGGHQKELARLLKDAQRGRFKLVLVWALDRLSREGALSILSLVHRLGIYGVKVISLQETWTEAPGELAELLYALTGWVARMESQRKSERTKAGLARALAQGKRLGRPPGARDKKKRKKGSARLPAWATV